jgi:hypothetical protein
MVLFDFVTVTSVFWLILAASIVHVFEEYYGGFVEMMRKYSPIRGMTKSVFAVVNAVFILLCVLAAIINSAIPVYSLSIAALIFINSLIHFGAAIRVRGYAAGLVSAIFLYIPLSISAYLLYSQAGLSNLFTFWLSFAVGAGWMGLALAYGLAINRGARRPKN